MAKEEKKAAKSPEGLEPKVRKQAARPTYEWGLNPHKLQLAANYVDANTSGLNAEERHDAIKARYVETKGRLPEQKRHKDGMHDTGTPRPTSEQAVRYDEGMDPSAKGEDIEDDDDEDFDGTTEEPL